MTRKNAIFSGNTILNKKTKIGRKFSFCIGKTQLRLGDVDVLSDGTHLFVKTLYQVSDIPPQILIEAVPVPKLRQPPLQRLDLGLAGHQVVHGLVQVSLVAAVHFLKGC